MDFMHLDELLLSAHMYVHTQHAHGYILQRALRSMCFETYQDFISGHEELEIHLGRHSIYTRKMR